jgi:hypothetical protein
VGAQDEAREAQADGRIADDGVIAFYEGVLALPTDQRLNLLRYLYAAAAADPDDDVQVK